MKNKTKTIFEIAAVIVTIIIVAIIFDFNDTDYTVMVIDKERVNQKEDSKYLIFCEESDGETIVFENTDILLRGKFNSSDIYALIKVGGRYKFTVVGFRIPFLSTYQNIIKVKEAG